MAANSRSVTLPLERIPDEIIDVRAPSEYADDHMPGAINLPVLTEEQRIEVGTRYKQSSAFEAKRLGAAHVSRNIAAMLENHFANKPPTYRPLVYCARGGQRSNSVATVLRAIGWRVDVLEGGYKSYRRHIIERLQQQGAGIQWRVINGLTGCGKTALLTYLASQGKQVLDLENLAAHRSSLLGRYTDRPQPSQCGFESAICHALSTLDLSQPIYVEAESRKVGNLQIPDPLWHRLVQSPVVELQLSAAARVEHLLAEYEHFLNSPAWEAHLKDKLDVLRSRHGHEQIDLWFAMIDSNQWPQLTHSLLQVHYDPSYRGGSRYTRPFATVSLDRVTAEEHAKALTQLDELAWDQPIR
jgi:tRNA 2-selenouridine synthase